MNLKAAVSELLRHGDPAGQEYLVAEAAIVGIHEHLVNEANQVITEANLVAYQRALQISHTLSEHPDLAVELNAALCKLEATLNTVRIGNPIIPLIEYLNDLTEKITLAQAHRQTR